MESDEALAERIDELRAALRSEHWRCLRDVLVQQCEALVDEAMFSDNLPPMPIELAQDSYLFGRLEKAIEARILKRYYLTPGNTIFDRQIQALTDQMDNPPPQPGAEPEQADLGDIQPDREIL